VKARTYQKIKRKLNMEATDIISGNSNEARQFTFDNKHIVKLRK